MNSMLHCYVRDRKNNPIGVVVAIKIDNKVHCGWSLVKKKSGDRFDKETGMSIAVGRAITHPAKDKDVPHTAQKYFTNIVVRATKYFKNCEFA